MVSHPVWVRGLKLKQCLFIRACQKSHPVWVRGLKLDAIEIIPCTDSRTPCGCVD